MEDKNDIYLIETIKERDEEIYPDFIYKDIDEKTRTIFYEINSNPCYSYFTENQLVNLKIEFFNEFSKKLLNSLFKVGDTQRESYTRILEQLADIFPPKNIKLIFTQENELQLFRKLKNGTSSIIIDEFGGVALSIIGKKGFGYKYDYFDVDQIDKKNAYLVTKDFLSDHFC